MSPAVQRVIVDLREGEIGHSYSITQFSRRLCNRAAAAWLKDRRPKDRRLPDSFHAGSRFSARLRGSPRPELPPTGNSQHRNRLAEDSRAKVGPKKLGAAHLRFGKVGAAQIRLRQIRPPQIGAVQTSFAQIRRAQLRVAQVRPFQICALKIDEAPDSPHANRRAKDWRPIDPRARPFRRRAQSARSTRESPESFFPL